MDSSRILLTNEHSDDTFHSFTQVNDDRFVRDSFNRNQQGSISLSLYSKAPVVQNKRE